MPLEAIKNKAIRGEAVSNGEIIIALSTIYDEVKNQGQKVKVLEDDMPVLDKKYNDLNQALSALTNQKIADAARHQGLMVIPKLGWSVISFIGFVPALIIGLSVWHSSTQDHTIKTLVTTVDTTKDSLDSQTDEIKANQRAILELLKKSDTYEQTQTKRQSNQDNNLPQ